MQDSMILWRRVDRPGHEACRFVSAQPGWRLEGTAIFRDGHDVACLNYWVACDRSWRTEEGEVVGWLGSTLVHFRVSARGGEWALNGRPVADLTGCVDLDLGFTPATNTFQLRRVGLAQEQGADVPVAWLDVRAGTLERLEQRYERRTEMSYWYTAPRFKYEALIQVDARGLVLVYPGLWEAER
jgi:hypothetical protein